MYSVNGYRRYSRDVDNAFIYIVPKYHNKIIATTDTSLGLPQLPQQFIYDYIAEYNKGNVITEVTVEYKTEEYCLPMPNIHVKQYREILKINSDSTINIKPIKNTWNREEVVELINKFNNIMSDDQQLTQFGLDKWLEENL